MEYVSKWHGTGLARGWIIPIKMISTMEPWKAEREGTWRLLLAASGLIATPVCALLNKAVDGTGNQSTTFNGAESFFLRHGFTGLCPGRSQADADGTIAPIQQNHEKLPNNLQTDIGLSLARWRLSSYSTKSTHFQNHPSGTWRSVSTSVQRTSLRNDYLIVSRF